jgi:hypothetical protein
MKTVKSLGLLLDLLLLAASLATGGQIREGIQRAVLLVAMIVAGVVIVCVVILTVALVESRKPPYRMVP